jgi:hypothetical protein
MTGPPRRPRPQPLHDGPPGCAGVRRGRYVAGCGRYRPGSMRIGPPSRPAGEGGPANFATSRWGRARRGRGEPGDRRAVPPSWVDGRSPGTGRERDANGDPPLPDLRQGHAPSLGGGRPQASGDRMVAPTRIWNAPPATLRRGSTPPKALESAGWTPPRPSRATTNPAPRQARPVAESSPPRSTAPSAPGAARRGRVESTEEGPAMRRISSSTPGPDGRPGSHPRWLADPRAPSDAPAQGAGRHIPP